MKKQNEHCCRCINWFSRIFCKFFNKPECLVQRTWDRVNEKQASSIQGSEKMPVKVQVNRDRVRYH